jgi:hypothetical protein
VVVGTWARFSQAGPRSPVSGPAPGRRRENGPTDREALDRGVQALLAADDTRQALLAADGARPALPNIPTHRKPTRKDRT